MVVLIGASLEYELELVLLSADLQNVSTVTIDGIAGAGAVELLPDDRVLVAADHHTRVLEGLVAPMANKPAHKRALAGGASARGSGAHSWGPALKHGRSWAGLSSAAAAAMIPFLPSSDDREEGGSVAAAEAEAEPRPFLIADRASRARDKSVIKE